MRWFLKLDTSLVNGIDRKERLEYIFHVKKNFTRDQYVLGRDEKTFN